MEKGNELDTAYKKKGQEGESFFKLFTNLGWKNTYIFADIEYDELICSIISQCTIPLLVIFYFPKKTERGP